MWSGNCFLRLPNPCVNPSAVLAGRPVGRPVLRRYDERPATGAQIGTTNGRPPERVTGRQARGDRRAPGQFGCRPKCSIARSRISTLRILPVIVIGNSFTSSTYLGIL